MAKQELSIESSYLPTWGVWEGVREIVQNGKDAETEHQAKLSVTYSKGKLLVTNQGTTIPLESLLLGRTSKLGKDDLIGQFGEGLDLGLLALARAGRSVKIRTGDQVWKPVIAASKSFDADVLWIEYTGGRKFQNRVQFEVEVTKAEWEEFRCNFMFLGEVPSEEFIKTPRGKLLLSPRLKGRLYVKGIFVEFDPKAEYGYDYTYASVDRDRKMVSAWDKGWENARIWLEAVNKDPDTLFESFFSLLQDEASDLAGFTDYNVGDLNEATVNMVAAKFAAMHGDSAVPVDNLEQSKQLEHLGRKGVVTSKRLRLVVERKQGSLVDIQESLRKAVTKTYSWYELGVEEKANVDLSVRLIQSIEDFPDGANIMELIHVVDFRSDTLLGQFKEGNIFLAKKILVDREETVATLVHEFAHFGGGDGAYGHVALMERLWKGVVKALLDGKVLHGKEEEVRI